MVLARSTVLVTCSRESSRWGRRCSERSLCLAAYGTSSRCLYLGGRFRGFLAVCTHFEAHSYQIPGNQSLCAPR